MAINYKFSKTNSSRTAVATPLKDVFDRFLDVYKLRARYNETYILAKWEEIVGQGIARRTTSLVINDKKLYIQLSSAPLRNELLLAKSKFITLLNQELGVTVIEDIIFV